MKKWVVYLCGVLTGIVLTLLVSVIIAYSGNSKNDSIAEKAEKGDNITMFDEPGDIVEDNNFKVFQVVADDAALVNAKSEEDLDLYLGKVYLLINDDGKYYYDDQIIKATQGKVFRQVGICRYPTRNDMVKTVPIIMLMDK